MLKRFDSHKGAPLAIRTADGKPVQGRFVRMYGAKVQIRCKDGRKLTGTLLEYSRPLGSAQRPLLEFLREHPHSSYGAIAKQFGWKVPRTVITVRTLLARGMLTKSLVDGRNHYHVL